MNILVTGASGFLGGRVISAAINAGNRVTCTDIAPGSSSCSEEFIQCDLTDPDMVREKLGKGHYDSVIHLAGIRGSLPAMTRVNVAGTANLLENLSPATAHVTLAGSCSVYGVPQDPSGSVKESHPLAPVTDYGRTMAEKEQTAAALCTKRGIQFASARLFNLFGAGQQTSMMTSAVADRLIRIFLELTPPPLRTGPLQTRRDMTDAGDAAEAMVKMTMTRIDGIFNIGTGKAVSGRRIVDEMQAILGSDIPVEEGTSTDPMVECIYADISKTSSLLGWNASTPMQATLKNILDHCRGLIPGLPG